MKTPTLEEVRDYLKDAEIVEDNNGIKGKMSRTDKRGIHFLGGNYFIYDKKKANVLIWSRLQGYAKILSYKEPKEKTYKITKEQILDIEKATYSFSGQMVRDEIKKLFPEVVETKLTVGKWYWSHNRALWCVEAFESSQRITAYGFNAIGDWSNSTNRQPESLTEATKQEVEDALIKEAVKRGYKNGNYNCLFLPNLTHKVVENFHYRKEDDTLYQGKNQDSKNNAVYSKGKWAEILETLTIQEAEAKLNCKIV